MQIFRSVNLFFRKKPFLTLLFSLLFVISLMLFSACQKGDTATDILAARFQLNSTPLEDLVSNPVDKQDEYINKEEVKIAKVLVELAKKQDFLHFVMETGKKNHGIITYDALFSRFPNVKDLFANTAIAKRYKIGSGQSTTSMDELDYDFIHNNYAYKSVIFIPNYDIVTTTENPAVGPEIEIEDDFDNNNHDIIFAWQLIDGNINEVNIGERDALNSNSLIILTGLVTVKEILATTQSVQLINRDLGKTDSSRVVEARANAQAKIVRFRLNKHYDRSSWNEVYGVGAQFVDAITSPPVGFGIAGQNPVPSNFFIAYVNRNEIATTDIIRNIFFYNVLNFASIRTHQVFYNTYERDWYCTAKELGSVQFADSSFPAPFSGRRKYTEEWYSFNPKIAEPPFALTPKQFPVRAFSTNGSFLEIFEENKGNMLFEKQ